MDACMHAPYIYIYLYTNIYLRRGYDEPPPLPHGLVLARRHHRHITAAAAAIAGRRIAALFCVHVKNGHRSVVLSLDEF